MKTQQWKWLVVALVLAALASAGALNSTQAAPERTVLRVGMSGSPRVFNPLRTTDDNSLRALEFMWRPLAWWDDDLKFQPLLAESWSISSDGLTWTFNLRRNVRWSDGTPFTANDVALTWKLLAHKATGGIWVGALRNIKGVNEYFDGKATDVEGIEVVSPNTLRVRLVAAVPEAMFLQDIQYFILPSHILRAYPPDRVNDAPFWSKPNVSIGPYIFEEYVTDQFIRLRKNPQYWQGAPAIDEVIIRLGTTDSLIAGLEKGEIDLFAIPPTEAARLKSLSHLTIHTMKGASYNRLLHINTGRPYLSDKRVRQAMAYAIDRPGIVQTAYEGYGVIVTSPSKAAWAVPPNEPKYALDVEKAKQLLKEANWNAAQEITMLVSSSSSLAQRVAAIIRESLGAIGMRVKVESVDSPTVFTRAQRFEYDLVDIGWSFNGDPNEIARVYWSENVPPAGWNIMKYKNARVDELFKQGRVTLDPQRRTAIYRELQSILADELPAIVLLRQDFLWGINNRVKGVNIRKYRKEALPTDTWNVHTWRIEGR
jgi:peptide/nickel transport system substrate-binding protein